MDEFFDWILDCYANGEMTDEDMDRALNDDYFAYDLFLDCWKCDRIGTGKMAQEVVKKAKNYLSRRKNGNIHT